MNIPWRITCQCGETTTVPTKITDLQLSGECPKCKQPFQLDLTDRDGFSIGYRLFRRAEHEFFQEKDFNMAIVMSAVAIDCELTRIYKKLQAKRGKKQRGGRPSTRRMRSKRKIEEITRLLYPGGIPGFLANHPDFDGRIRTGYPSLEPTNLPRSIVRVLFWKRNSILHEGNLLLDEREATRCKNVAQLTLRVFRMMEFGEDMTIWS